VAVTGTCAGLLVLAVLLPRSSKARYLYANASAARLCVFCNTITANTARR